MNDSPAYDALYVHVPFCPSKCPYCDFASGVAPVALHERYVAALIGELAALPRPRAVRTVFVGGGTPTHLSAPLLDALLEALADFTREAPVEEFTVEANPGTLDAEKVALLAARGVTRVSLGVQSLHDPTLARLARAHDAAQARAARALLAAAAPSTHVPPPPLGGRVGVGGESAPPPRAFQVNLDLIFAVPGQTRAQLAADLDRLIALAPDHVSAYALTFEPGTAFFARRAAGRLRPVPEDREAAMLDQVWARLAAAGFRGYEISNFARPGAQCRHNLAYWRGADYLGLGCGAVSRRGAVRTTRWRDPARYVAELAEGRAPIAEEETLTPGQHLLELAMMGLRLHDGIETAVFARRVGPEWGALIDPAARADLQARGWLECAPGRWRASDQGRRLLDLLLARLAAGIDTTASPPAVSLSCRTFHAL